MATGIDKNKRGNTDANNNYIILAVFLFIIILWTYFAIYVTMCSITIPVFLFICLAPISILAIFAIALLSDWFTEQIRANLVGRIIANIRSHRFTPVVMLFITHISCALIVVAFLPGARKDFFQLEIFQTTVEYMFNSEKYCTVSPTPIFDDFVTPTPTDTPVTPIPTDTPIPPTPTDIPTDTPIPPTPTDTPTPTPTDTPTPTPTDTPTPTNTPIPPIPTRIPFANVTLKTSLTFSNLQHYQATCAFPGYDISGEEHYPFIDNVDANNVLSYHTITDLNTAAYHLTPVKIVARKQGTYEWLLIQTGKPSEILVLDPPLEKYPQTETYLRVCWFWIYYTYVNYEPGDLRTIDHELECNTDADQCP